MKCPKCPGELSPAQFNGVEYERCGSCNGMWFDAFEHEELKAMPGSEAIDTQSAPNPDVGAATLACPKCSQKLFRMVVPGQPHIALDTCGFCHGVFFDAGEFRDFKEETLRERLRDLLRLAQTAPPA